MPAVNPYSFVPLVGRVRRGRPNGHGKLSDGLLCGQLTVKVVAKTPLKVGADDRSLFTRSAAGELIIPGSSLKGAVRSIHEALTNSCLRIVDTGYSPIHRAVPTRQVLDGWSLGIITEVRDLEGEPIPTKVRVCSRTVRVLADSADGTPEILPRVTPGGAPWRTGDRLELTVGATLVRGLPAADTAKRTTAGDWVLLVTEIPATRRRHPIYFVAGGADGGLETPLAPRARAALRAAITGADDLRPNVGGPPDFVEVIAPRLPGLQWERARVRKQFTPGMPIWVHGNGGDTGRIDAAKLSQIWRQPGEGRMHDRLGDATPCTDPRDLCPSCQIFGSAGEDEDADGPTTQSSYAGHVRFEDLKASAGVEPSSRPVAQLMSPKPTAGQFYLDSARYRGQAAGQDERPLAHWGSRADAALRPIRGRKFYWATSVGSRDGLPTAARHRANPAPGVDTPMVEIVGKDSAFTGRLTFEGVTREQLGGLIAALDPRQVWPARNVTSRLGGGKPFGWGAVEVTVTVEWIKTAEQRYGTDQSRTAAAGSDLVDDFLKTIDNLDSESLVSLRNLLTLDYVDDDKVRYPRDAGPDDFAFWTRSAGRYTRDHGSALDPLPLASEAPQAQQVGRD